MWWGKLVPEPFIKIEITHTSGSTVRNVMQLVFIVYPSGGLPKYINTKVLTTCFDFKVLSSFSA